MALAMCSRRERDTGPEEHPSSGTTSFYSIIMASVIYLWIVVYRQKVNCWCDTARTDKSFSPFCAIFAAVMIGILPSTKIVIPFFLPVDNTPFEPTQFKSIVRFRTTLWSLIPDTLE